MFTEATRKWFEQKKDELPGGPATLEEYCQDSSEWAEVPYIIAGFCVDCRRKGDKERVMSALAHFDPSLKDVHFYTSALPGSNPVTQLSQVFATFVHASLRKQRRAHVTFVVVKHEDCAAKHGGTRVHLGESLPYLLRICKAEERASGGLIGFGDSPKVIIVRDDIVQGVISAPPRYYTGIPEMWANTEPFSLGNPEDLQWYLKATGITRYP